MQFKFNSYYCLLRTVVLLRCLAHVCLIHITSVLAKKPPSQRISEIKCRFSNLLLTPLTPTLPLPLRGWNIFQLVGVRGVILICLIILTSPTIASAKIEEKVLGQAQTYLNNIRTLKAGFTQIAPNGQISSGTLYLKRAGKMRWEYNPPTPIIMVTRGTFLRYYDHELEQISDIPIEGTIAAYLAKDKINFADGDITVLEASATDGVQVVRITSRKAPDEGEISFIFSERPYILKNILTRDAKGLDTTIALDDVTHNLPLDDKLFAIFDPNINKRKRK